MTSFGYTQNIPNPPNLPSADVGNMQTNTNSINSIINVDHVSFGGGGSGFSNIDGTHRQVSLIDQAAPALPAGINGELFSNQVAGQSWPFWQNRASQTAGTPIQLLSGIPSNVIIGFTFLPGNVLIQWGTTLAAASGVAILFPKLFSGVPYSVQVTVTNNSTTHRTYTSTNGVGASGFEPILLSTNGTPETDDIMWIAIGPV